MSDEFITPDEQTTIKLYATQELLLAVINEVCRQSSSPEATRQRIASSFEDLAAGFDFHDVSPEKASAGRDLLVHVGLGLLARKLPE